MFRITSRSFRAFASAAVVVCVAAPFAHSATVTGRVLDSTTSLPLAGVEVLVDGVPAGVTTDLMGQFKTEVGEGDRLFTFKRTGFSEQSVGPLAIPAEGEAAVPDAKLAPDAASDILMLEALTVESDLVKGSAGDLQNTRLKADVAIDFLSAEQLAKFSAGDMAEAIIRIPGVSVANGQFAVVRGLSDRYLSTTLEGLKLPSPDPEKQAVQMDLLPTNAIGSIVVSKTFSSDLWAESGGGNIDILTNALPEEQILKVGAGIKFNSNALDGGPDYEVGNAFKERLGFGADARPASGERSGSWQYIPTRRSGFPLGNEVGVEYGRTFAVGSGDDKLGVSFGVTNETGTKVRSGTRQSFSVSPGTQPSGGSPGSPSGFEDPSIPLARGILFDSEQSQTESIFGANATVAYRFSPEHEIKLNGLFIQSGIDVSQVNQNRIVVDDNLQLATQDGYSGFSGAEERAWFKTYEYYRERNLTDVQLSGSHKLPAAADLGIDWAVQHATTYQKESPLIEATFATPLSDPYASYELLGSNDAPDPLSIVWADNEETQDAGRLDFTLPRALWTEEESTFKVGAAAESTTRDVQGDAIFFSNPTSTLSNPTPNGLYEELTSNSTTPVNSFSTEANASRDIRAAYVGANIVLAPRLKLVAGSRFEDYQLEVSGEGQWGNYRASQFYTDQTVLGADASGSSNYRSRVWYPGVGLIYEPVKKVSVRLHYSETSGRPSLREVSPFFNKSIETGNLVIGNPALKPSDVSSYDLRVEWNPAPGDAVAVSVFRKDIHNPIEKLLFNTTAQTSEFSESWVNNPNTAHLNGFEFEARHDLARWSDLLAGFSVGGNFTWIDASVEENPYVIQRVSSNFQDPDNIPRERRLFDQPEYIVNVDLNWTQPRWGTSVTVAGYAISDVLETAGLLSSSYDLYQRSTTRVDLIFSQRLSKNLKFKFSVKNLTDPIQGTIYDRDATEGTVARTRYRSGRDFSFSLTAEF